MSSPQKLSRTTKIININLDNRKVEFETPLFFFRKGMLTLAAYVRRMWAGIL
jgi:hypothetical protein